MLQEILSVVRERLAKRLPDLSLDVTFPPEGQLVLVDYEYLVMALTLLIEAFVAVDGDKKEIRLDAVEEDDSWLLTFSCITANVVQILKDITCCAGDISVSEHMTSENVLKMCIAQQIFDLQGIVTEVNDKTDIRIGIQLVIPGFGD